MTRRWRFLFFIFMKRPYGESFYGTKKIMKQTHTCVVIWKTNKFLTCLRAIYDGFAINFNFNVRNRVK
jgi:hypothetical protein